METVRRLAVLLALGAVVSANPVNVQECTLKPVEKNEGVTVVYTTSRVTSGCISRGPIDPNLEVHVLSLKFSDPPKMLELPFSVSAAKGNSQRTVFVVSSNAPYILLKVSVTDHPLTFIHKPRRVYVQGSNSNATVLPESDEELLKWVDEKYGGVSSFAVLDKPSRVHFKVGREPSATPDCIPQPDFDAEQYLETETTSHETESCLGSSGNTGNESHILWLKEALGQAVDLNMKMTCDRGELPQGLPVLLVLKGPRGVLWKIDELPPYTKFLTSGNYSIKTFGLWPVEGTNLSDTKEGLMKEAYLNGFPSIASFTEIPSAKSIILELVRCAEARATTSPRVISPSESSLNEKFQQLLRTFPSWRCMDDAIEVALPRSYLLALKGSISEITLEDPSCRAKENATHFVLSSKLGDCKTQVEENIRAKNQLVLTVASVPDKITVPFQCDLPEKLSLHLCPALDCSLPLSTITVVVNQVTYVQVSFRTTNKESSVQLRDCFLRTPGTASPQPLIHEGTPQGSVQILSSSRPGTPQIGSLSRREAGEPQPSAQPRLGDQHRVRDHFRRLLHRSPPHRSTVVHLLSHPSDGQDATSLDQPATLREQQHQSQHREHPEHPLLHQQHGIATPAQGMGRTVCLRLLVDGVRTAALLNSRQRTGKGGLSPKRVGQWLRCSFFSAPRTQE